jgi:hypothetical protein
MGEEGRLKTICRCQHCNQPLEFDSTDAGGATACPHCQMETTVFIPQGKPPVPSGTQWDAAADAPRSLEDKLDSAASGIFTGGMFACLVIVIIALAPFMIPGEPNFLASGVEVFSALTLAASGWLLSLAFRWAAEVLRQLRITK